MTRLKSWLPVLCWAALIFTGSTDTFSSQHSAGVIVRLLHWLLPRASEATLDLLHLLIRKCAHLTEYFIFSLLLWRGIRTGPRDWRLRWAVIVVMIAACYAGLDEFHQSFVPSRTASPWDALLDTTGATLAQLAVWVWARQQHWTGTSRLNGYHRAD